MGIIIKAKIKELRYSMTAVAEGIRPKSITRETLRKWLKQPVVPWYQVRAIGKAMRYDMGRLFPGMPLEEGVSLGVEDPQPSYGLGYSELLKEHEQLRRKYTTSLEELAEARRQNLILQEQLLTKEEYSKR